MVKAGQGKCSAGQASALQEGQVIWAVGQSKAGQGNGMAGLARAGLWRANAGQVG